MFQARLCFILSEPWYIDKMNPDTIIIITLILRLDDEQAKGEEIEVGEAVPSTTTAIARTGSNNGMTDS